MSFSITTVSLPSRLAQPDQDMGLIVRTSDLVVQIPVAVIGEK